MEVDIGAGDLGELLRLAMRDRREVALDTVYELRVVGGESDGLVVEDDTVLSEVAGLAEGTSYVQMVAANYTVRSSVAHVRQLFDLFRSYDPSRRSLGGAVLPLLTEADADKGVTAASLLSEVYPAVAELPKAVESWAVQAASGKAAVWAGKCSAVQVTTVEGVELHVTGTVGGFEGVAARGKGRTSSARTLGGLLSMRSAGFRKALEAALDRRAASLGHLPERQFAAVVARPWLGRAPVEDPMDAAREEHFAELDMVYRDWNASYQSVREATLTSYDDRMSRDRTLYRLHLDFVDVAEAAVVEIVDNGLRPINPAEPPDMHVYQFRNAFVVVASDFRNHFPELGPRAAHKVSNSDMRAAHVIASLDVSGVFTLLMTTVDYCGHRFVAQALIHGILMQDSPMMYGSPDPPEKRFFADPDFHKRLLPIAERLCLLPHKIFYTIEKEVEKNDEKNEKNDEKNEENEEMVEIVVEKKSYDYCMPWDFKGVLATDGRSYVLEVGRVTPRDTSYTKGLAFHRPDFMNVYRRFLADECVARVKEENKDASEEEFQGLVEAALKEMPAFVVHPNVLLDDVELDIEADELAKHETLVRDMGTALVVKAVPLAGAALERAGSMESVGEKLHELGVPVRLLGRVVQLDDVTMETRALVLSEILARSAKLVMRAAMRAARPPNLPVVVAHVLSCLFGQVTKPTKATTVNGGGKGVGKVELGQLASNPLRWTSATVIDAVLADAAEHFDCGKEVPTREAAAVIMARIPVLRRVCRMCGVRLSARAYALGSQTPISAEDVLDVASVVKHYPPEPDDTRRLMTMALVHMDRGQVASAIEVASEAMDRLVQTHGSLHHDVPNCMTLLYNILEGSIGGGPLPQLRRTIEILEQLYGPDHDQLPYLYHRLGMAHLDRSPALAQVYLTRSLRLKQLVREPNHEDCAANVYNIGMCQLRRKLKREALASFLEASRIIDILTGPRMKQSTVGLLVTVQAVISSTATSLALHHIALDAELKNYTVLSSINGLEHAQTKASIDRLRSIVPLAIKTEDRSTPITIKREQFAHALDKLSSENKLFRRECQQLTDIIKKIDRLEKLLSK